MTAVVSLIGYRGTGKSTVAPLLASRLGCDWRDADREIERSVGRTIPEIFATEGESTFRRLERSVIVSLLRSFDGKESNGLVLATGGGAILDSDTRDDLRRAGPVVWLTASVASILSRLSSDETSRPRLTDAASVREEIESVLCEREPLYREAMSTTVNTDEIDADDVAERVYQFVRREWDS